MVAVATYLEKLLLLLFFFYVLSIEKLVLNMTSLKTKRNETKRSFYRKSL